jgi:glycine cleavage system transcriptional repressor
MASVALVSVLCADRVGLVSAIADHLFDVGVNLRDTIFAALGAGAGFTAVCELPDGLTAEELETGLGKLDVLAGAQVWVVPYSFDPEPGEAGRVTHRIAVSGGDQLGLVARLADVFAQYEANIVRLEARKLSDAEGGLYVTRFAVSIPPGPASLCLATVANTAGSLGLTSQVEESAL